MLDFCSKSWYHCIRRVIQQESKRSLEYDKEKEEKKLRKAERECGREEGRMEERKSLLALIAKMSAGGDADKIIRLEDPEVMNAMQKKYGTGKVNGSTWRGF